jgi:SAM-dependent methyltransferase
LASPDSSQIADCEKYRAQFEFERECRRRLLGEANPDRRRTLYRESYRELYARFFASGSGKTEFGSRDHFLEMMRPWLAGRTVIDIGCGLGRATSFFGTNGGYAVGLEVDTEVVRRCRERFHDAAAVDCTALPFDGTRMPLADGSVDIAYSNNVIEHLHPDDARAQMAEIHRVLKPQGVFVCITPPRSTGPHDVSKFFLPPGAEPQGLHLKEYELGELAGLLASLGFRNLSQPWIGPDRLLRWGLIRLYPLLQRSVPMSTFLEGSIARRSGFLTGTFCLDMICLLAHKNAAPAR